MKTRDGGRIAAGSRRVHERLGDSGRDLPQARDPEALFAEPSESPERGDDTLSFDLG